MAVHVRYYPIIFLCRPLQETNVKLPNFALSGERETRWLFF